jgi:hypothetical protein
MKRTLLMAAALTLAAGVAAAQEPHDEGRRPPPRAAAPHAPAPAQEGHAGPAGPPASFHGQAPAQPFHAGAPAPGPVARFDGNRGQGLGPHAAGRVVYQGRSFTSFRAAPFSYPGGWGYRRWTVGQVLPGLFLSQGYYIGNWGAYGLAPPPPDLQWVRYGPDALLVNVYTGQVVDTVYGVFWW